jgi:site-specific DNA recombinase
MNAIGYIRLSDEDQSNYSLEGQERQIMDYCTRNNLQLLKIYKDNGESSYTFDRKAFGALEKEIKQAQYLVVYHLDRFSRNMAEAMIKVSQYLNKGIRIRDVTEQLDMDDYDPNVFMMRTLKFMTAEMELHNIRRRTKKGMVDAAMEGRHAAPAPVGYKNARDVKDKPILHIDDEKAFIVRILFREYLNGMGIEDLRRMIARYEYKPKGNSTIQRILSNPLYAGYVKVPAQKSKPAHLIKGIHDPIISEQDYWLVQDRLQGKGINLQNRDEVPLRGVLACGCGRKFTAGNSKGRTKYYWYYFCHGCRQNLSASRLHKIFNELLDNLKFDPNDLQALQIMIKKKLDEHINNRGNKMDQVQKQLKLVESKISGVEEKYLIGNVSEATYQRVITGLRADQSRLYAELTKLNTNYHAYWDKLNQMLAVLSDLRAEFEKLTLDRQHQFINWVFDNSLSYENNIYRTAYLNELFRHNLLTLKEKGLLEIVAPVKVLGITPRSTRPGNSVEPEHSILDSLDKLIAIFAA